LEITPWTLVRERQPEKTRRKPAVKAAKGAIIAGRLIIDLHSRDS
jgi:hypothetical protein